MSVVVGFKEVGKFVEIYVVGTWVENAVVEGLIVVSIEVVSSVVECNVDNPLVDG